MSELERDLQRLHRYHDGELSGMERRLFERRMRSSPALRHELRALEGVSALLAEAELGSRPTASPDLWDGIASALPAIDAQVTDERARAVGRRAATSPSRSRWLGLPGWAVGTAALAAAALVALLVIVGSPGGPTTPAPATGAVVPVVAHGGGVVRYLDSGGASVMVIEDPEADMTIVWMMDAV